MAHPQRGYLVFSEECLSAGGEDERVLGQFIQRNSRGMVESITDEAGRFTLTNFTAPDERWNIGAGSNATGYALRTGVRPNEHVDQPLRLTLTEPAYLTVSLPAGAKGRRYLGATLAPDRAAGAAEPDDDGERVWFYGSWSYDPDSNVRIGPLPGGVRVRLVLSTSARNLPYQPTLFAREVDTVAGTTQAVAMESKEGTAVSGRLVSTEDAPLANVNVLLQTADGLAIGAITDDKGHYELKGVPAGAHTLKLLRHAKRTSPG